MVKPPKLAQFHTQYWAVSPFYGARVVSGRDARDAWRAADHVDGTAEFGFHTTIYTDTVGSALGSSFLPMTSYPLPPAVVEGLAPRDGKPGLLQAVPDIETDDEDD